MKTFLKLLVAVLVTYIIYAIIEAATQTFVSDIIQVVLVMHCAMYIIDNVVVPILAKSNNYDNKL